MPELSEEDKEDIIVTIIKHFENPEPDSPLPKGGRRYGGKFRRRSSSNKDTRKSTSDKENNPGSVSPISDDHKTVEEKPQNEITISHENGDNK